MPWQTPTLSELRTQGRDYVTGKLGSGALVPNSPTRVMSDNNAGLVFLTLLYLDWLAKQLMADTAEEEWLHRHAEIWLGGWKQATFAAGALTATGTIGKLIPAGTVLVQGQVRYEADHDVTLGGGPTNVDVTAIDAGAAGNLEPGTKVSLVAGISGVDGALTVVTLEGGTDAETDDELRIRVLDRIRQPPMGGDANDYAAWALQVPGVTRAWASPLEMGMGTVTVRFMMDDLRAGAGGFPEPGDVATVQAYLDTKRPVAVKDFFVEAPIAEPVSFTISNLDGDSAATRAAITASVTKMLADRAKPAYALNGVAQNAQTIFAAWVSAAILDADGVISFDLTMADHVMPDKGHIGVLGTITYA